MLELTTETRASTAGDMINREAWRGDCKCGAPETADFGRLEFYRRRKRLGHGQWHVLLSAFSDKRR